MRRCCRGVRLLGEGGGSGRGRWAVVEGRRRADGGREYWEGGLRLGRVYGGQRVILGSRMGLDWDGVRFHGRGED